MTQTTTILIASCSVGMLSTSAYGQAVITSAHRSVGATSSYYDPYPDGRSESESFVSEDRYGRFDQTASANVGGNAIASMQSDINEEHISASIFTDASGWYIDDTGYTQESHGAGASIQVDFTVTTLTPFVLDIESDAELSWGSIKLISSASTIFDLSIHSWRPTASQISGELPPDSYVLTVLVYPGDNSGGGFITQIPASLDFVFTMAIVPAPSAVALLAAPALMLGVRRRRRAGPWRLWVSRRVCCA